MNAAGKHSRPAAGPPEGDPKAGKGTPHGVHCDECLRAERTAQPRHQRDEAGQSARAAVEWLPHQRAADDAAGLGISEKMRAQIRGNTQGIRNAQDGISMLQTAEGAMDEIHGMLQRMRELAVQGANDTYDTNARNSMGQEIVQLRSEIDRIAGGTTFNGQNLLTGTLSGTLGGASTVKVGTAFSTTGGDMTVDKVDVSAAKAQTYTFSQTATTLTLTGTNGQAQTIATPVFGANSLNTINFNQLGISIEAVSVAGKTAAGIGTDLDTKTVVVSGTGAATLQVGANATANDTLAVSFGGRAGEQRDGAEPEHGRPGELDEQHDDRGEQHRFAGAHHAARRRHHDAEHRPR